MKKFSLYLLMLSGLMLTACPGVKYEGAKDKLFKNRMDLPNSYSRYYQGIRFELSDLFETAYNSDYVIKDDALNLINYELNLYFSVEVFSQSEAKSYQYTFSNELDELNAVHDYYVLARQQSLARHFTSIKKPVAKTVGFKGVSQTIEGVNEFAEDKLMYLMSTVEVGNKYYVFQMIGKKENMGYLNDDFLDIINSIEK